MARCLLARRYRMLWLAIFGSLALHSLLLLPWYQPVTPPSQPVILAQLQAKIPHYTEGSVPTSSAKTPTESNRDLINNTKDTKQEQPKKITTQAQTKLKTTHTTSAKQALSQSITEQSNTNAKLTDTSLKPTPEAIGLNVSQDNEALDPLEQQFQQILLAHLRSKLVAPTELFGTVRLAIKFSYRQIATEVVVIHSSGHTALDDWALKAVLAANPFPPIPKELPDDFVFRPTLQIGD